MPRPPYLTHHPGHCWACQALAGLPSARQHTAATTLPGAALPHMTQPAQRWVPPRQAGSRTSGWPACPRGGKACCAAACGSTNVGPFQKSARSFHSTACLLIHTLRIKNDLPDSVSRFSCWRGRTGLSVVALPLKEGLRVPWGRAACNLPVRAPPWLACLCQVSRIGPRTTQLVLDACVGYFENHPR